MFTDSSDSTLFLPSERRLSGRCGGGQGCWEKLNIHRAISLRHREQEDAPSHSFGCLQSFAAKVLQLSKMKPQNFHFRQNVLCFLLPKQRWYTLLMQEDVIKCFWCFVGSTLVSHCTETAAESEWQCLRRVVCRGLGVVIIKCQLERIALFMHAEASSRCV